MNGFEKNTLGLKQPQGYPGLPDSWESECESFLASDGQSKLFALFHHRKNSAPLQKILVVAHGFGEHGGRYLHFPHYLGDSIDALYVHDLRGHGRSEGMRGDAPSFESLVEDQKLVIKRIHARFPDAELHFLGHSIGGHIGLRVGFLHAGLPLKTFQISAPYLALYQEPALALRVAAGVLAKTWSSLSLSADIDASLVSRDERVIENYATDRLNHARMSPRFYASMKIAQKDTRSRVSGLNYPLSLHLPLADRLISAKVSREFFDALQNEGKQLFEYPELRHEAMNDIGKEAFFENMKTVIDHSEMRDSEKTSVQK
ncbi:MAG: lysophospholipase [Cryobacterium sp.]|nr:lysophospholipase [Oligoflexia bacterium]